MAGSSRAQLQTLLNHLRRAIGTSGAFAGDEQTRSAEARRRTQTLLIDRARNAASSSASNLQGGYVGNLAHKPGRAEAQAIFDMAQLKGVLKSNEIAENALTLTSSQGRHSATFDRLDTFRDL